MYGERK